ncbi:XRE family transcriptional regulator [Mammaliicoccus sciuri]|uniref:XRE family transcriptional regulator n=1 Tax=Mammaliicoccus sciuri TaxID=1296 RepID=UPI001950BB6E|nr:XRE family transcriptional regulator [Mammaliicoccus sciuri]
MLRNLDDVRKKKNVTLVDIGDLLEVRYQTVADKINEVSDFKFGEALLIKNKFFPEYEIEYLFKSDKNEEEELKA